MKRKFNPKQIRDYEELGFINSERMTEEEEDNAFLEAYYMVTGKPVRNENVNPVFREIINPLIKY